jgi:hypothetical protein
MENNNQDSDSNTRRKRINSISNNQIMTRKAVAERLLAFNKWRTGEDDRTMDEAELKPRQITLDIEFACKILSES